AIEAFDVGVLIRFARLDVMDRRLVRRAPLDKGLGEEFRAIVHAHRRRRPVHEGQRLQYARHAEAGQRRADYEVDGFAVAFVDDREQPHPAVVVQGVAHEVQGPGVIELGRRVQRLTHALRDTATRTPRQIEPQSAVHAMHPLVVPCLTLRAQPVEALPEAPATVALDHSRQGVDDHGVSMRRIVWRPVVRRPRQPHHATGPLHGELVLLNQHGGDLALRGRPYSFRWSTSLMAAFSSAKSAYIRFSRAFSVSSSRSRFTSDTVAPPYLLRHLKNVGRLMPCFRNRSATGTPPSASRRIATI